MFIHIHDRKRGSGTCGKRGHSGQSVLEYALLVSVLAAVFLTMFFYMKNAVRARLLITQDRLNEVR